MNLRPRRYLPSIPSLLAFEAVIRTRSTTSAAQDLDLTQSTVSRLVQTLEEQLGSPLFERHRKRLHPTAIAIEYAGEVTRALNILQQASMQIAVNPAGGTISIATLPTFGTRWLAPRLGAFLSQNPGISLNLSTRVPRFDFEVESFDAAIFYGRGDWPGAMHQKLFDEFHVACAAPEFLRRNPATGIEEVASMPLLHLENRPDSWKQWFRVHGLEMPSRSGMMMDQFSMIIQAAIQGVGIALLPRYLFEAEFAEGRLHALPFPAVRSDNAYWIAWPVSKDASKPLEAFRAWIAGQTNEPSEPAEFVNPARRDADEKSRQ